MMNWHNDPVFVAMGVAALTVIVSGIFYGSLMKYKERDEASQDLRKAT